MKKTVTLTNLLKAKTDLELFIKVNQIQKLKKLFDPTFDIKEINSQIDEKENQLISIKLAIQEANTNTKDSDGKPLNYTIYLLSKYNREKSDIQTCLNRIESKEFLDSSSLKEGLLKDIQELDDLYKKETDKKKKAEYLSSKNKLKKSLSKISLTSKSHDEELYSDLKKRLVEVEDLIATIKPKMTETNNKTEVEVEVHEGFDIAIK